VAASASPAVTTASAGVSRYTSSSESGFPRLRSHTTVAPTRVPRGDSRTSTSTTRTGSVPQADAAERFRQRLRRSQQPGDAYRKRESITKLGFVQPVVHHLESLEPHGTDEHTADLPGGWTRQRATAVQCSRLKQRERDEHAPV